MGKEDEQDNSIQLQIAKEILLDPKASTEMRSKARLILQSQNQNPKKPRRRKTLALRLGIALVVLLVAVSLIVYLDSPKANYQTKLTGSFQTDLHNIGFTVVNNPNFVVPANVTQCETSQSFLLHVGEARVSTIIQSNGVYYVQVMNNRGVFTYSYQEAGQ